MSRGASSELESESSHVVSLVRRALDEFDDVALSVIARRTLRAASLMADSETSVWLGLELKVMGGSPKANADDIRKLMADPELWNTSDGPHQTAMTRYLSHRALNDGTPAVLGHCLDEIEYWLSVIEDSPELLEREVKMRQVQMTVRHACFVALCHYERRLAYLHTNERIFAKFRSSVDALLESGAPEILEQFRAVYRRLADAYPEGGADASEAVAQAITSCRRILKAVADFVLPGVRGATVDGHSLSDDAYRNRIQEFIKGVQSSQSEGDASGALVEGLFLRFKALDQLANKGVHAAMGLDAAELCAISTYVVAGELLRLASVKGDPPPQPDPM